MQGPGPAVESGNRQVSHQRLSEIPTGNRESGPGRNQGELAPLPEDDGNSIGKRRFTPGRGNKEREGGAHQAADRHRQRRMRPPPIRPEVALVKKRVSFLTMKDTAGRGIAGQERLGDFPGGAPGKRGPADRKGWPDNKWTGCHRRMHFGTSDCRSQTTDFLLSRHGDVGGSCRG
jgi:hypothetical protein